MKTIRILILCVLAMVPTIQASAQAITITSSQELGTSIIFTLTGSVYDTPVQVDWGDGNLVDYTIGESGTFTEISGALAGNAIKIYGEGITDITAEDMPFNSFLCENNPFIKFISLYWCDLNSIGIKNNKFLESVFLENNNLTELNLLNDTLLTDIYCSNNKLTSIDVSQQKKLNLLYTFSNQLSSIDVSSNTALKNFACYNNKLASIDVSKNILLRYLSCSENLLTSIDLSKNTLLTGLDCYNNKLTEIDISNNPDLIVLNCWGNLLTSLDISNNLKISQLYVSYNQLTSIDLSQNTLLGYFHCSYNKLNTIVLNPNSPLRDFRCTNNQMTIASLPVPLAEWTSYVYSPQRNITLPFNHYTTSDAIDLSSQLSREGLPTIYTWRLKNGDELTQGGDYEKNNGVFTFLRAQSDSVYCQMTNENFPALLLETSKIKILSDIATLKEEVTTLRTSIYPNPCKDILNIESAESIRNIEIYSVLGTKLMDYITDGLSSAQIPLKSLSDGFLVIKVNYSKHSSIHQVVKK